MSKKHFIALADAIRMHNESSHRTPFDMTHLDTLAQFCNEGNGRFNRERWFNYIAGICGKNGGKV